MLAVGRFDNDLADHHWWFRARHAMIKGVLDRYVRRPSNILEVGCGSGVNLPLLGRYGTVVGADNDPVALQYCKASLGLADVRYGDVYSLDPSPHGYDVVAFFDVLEHLEYPLTGLKSIHRIMDPTTLLILTVPAFQRLWSRHDAKLGHYRRYTKKELAVELEKVDLESVYMRYHMGLLALAMLFYRNETGEAGFHTPGLLNSIACWLLKTEAWLKPPFIDYPGSTLIAVAKKVVD